MASREYKGTIVLVHGAGVGGWVYRDVATILRMHGYEVHTPTFTGTGERVHLLNREISLETHVKDIVNCVECNGLKNIVLLGHSYGAAIVSAVVDKIPNKIIKQVYLDGFFLENNQSIVDIFGAEREKELLKLVEVEGKGWLLPKRLFGKEHHLILDMPWAPYVEKVKLKNDTRHIPGYFIDCTNHQHFEHLIEPKKQMKKKCIDRKWKVYSLDSDHIPMTKSPERENLIDILLKIIEE